MNMKLALAERRVPRYTSYPTAPHFSESVGRETYSSWLGDLPREASLSLYLHVPFCTELCHYCGCNTKAVRRRAPVEDYARLLETEVDLLAAAVRNRRVVHVHWGGGTPSILGSAAIGRIVERLAGTFDLSALHEHAIELDPRSLTPNLALALARIGITRASLGVQDFSPHVQQAIGRIQSFDQVARAAGALRDAGIEEVNFDLMYGLPHQTVDDVIRTAELAASLAPSRLALFGYAHVPWFKTHQRLIEEPALAGPEERIAQMDAATATLEARGFVKIGLDHFAAAGDELSEAMRGGQLHRNFQGYTTDRADALIGIGASSIGRLPRGYVQNAPDVGSYARAVIAGHFAVAKGVAFSEDDRIRARIIERLMCDLAVDLTEVGEHVDFSDELEALDDLRNAGVVHYDGGRVIVTDAGRPYVRLVAAVFDAYLHDGKKRHSAAV
jgi:oxygen-independent coproporphyrinogen-3 oxidase